MQWNSVGKTSSLLRCSCKWEGPRGFSTDTFIDGKLINSNIQVLAFTARFDFLLIYILICVLKWMENIQQCPSLNKILCAASTSALRQFWKPSLLRNFHGGNYVYFPIFSSSSSSPSAISPYMIFFIWIVTKGFTLSKTISHFSFLVSRIL